MHQIEAFLHELCDAAAGQTLPRFRAALSVDNKEASGFDPVTEADRAAEAAIRALILERYPEHGIVGEEEDAVRPDAEYCWIIDPIDGTRSFICGLPSWGTLIGLQHRGRPIAGVMAQPFTGERYLGHDAGAFLVRGGERTRLATRRTASLADAMLMTTTPFLFDEGDIGRYRAVEASCRLTRYGYDCYAYAMVAAGQIDLVVESSLKSYDIAPLIPVIEAAGGIVTTWDGGPANEGGRILAAANPLIHGQAMRLLAG
jgi:histidinol phosphatase-like enzyme (inositol monophosphatase family)